MSEYYELRKIYDRHKSFYGKAQVKAEYPIHTLKSYDTDVCTYNVDTKKAVCKQTYSHTTLRHIKEFLKQKGLKAESKTQILKDYGTVKV